MNGWITIDRKLLDWQWYDVPYMVQLWIHLLLTANYEDKQWHGMTIQRGQLATSLGSLSEATGISVRSIRTCLDRLEQTGAIERKVTNKNTIVTICKYESYQCLEEVERQTTDNQTTSNRQATDKQVTTTKQINKETNITKENTTKVVQKKRFVRPSVEDIRAYAKEKNYSLDAQYFFDYYESKGWVVGKSPMKDWKAAVRNWMKNEKAPPTSNTTVSQLQRNTQIDIDYYTQQRQRAEAEKARLEANAEAIAAAKEQFRRNHPGASLSTLANKLSINKCQQIDSLKNGSVSPANLETSTQTP